MGVVVVVVVVVVGLKELTGTSNQTLETVHLPLGQDNH